MSWPLVESLDSASVEAWAHTFDIVDIHLDLSHVPGVANLKDLYDTDSLSLRELAGISRMARHKAWAGYDRERLLRLKDYDVGNRYDDFWIVNAERLLRSHPQRFADIYVDRFAEDVSLGLEILVQQEISMHYMQSWLMAQQASLRNRPTLDGAADDSAALEALAELAHVGSLLVDPVVLQRNVKHSFYNTVMSAATHQMGLERFATKLRDGLREYFELRDAVTRHESSAAAHAINKAQMMLGEQVGRLTRGTYILTMFVVLLMIAQLAVAYFFTNRSVMVHVFTPTTK